ncbi:MAG: response regulator transcription factor [Lachnospiraceae bacterium]
MYKILIVEDDTVIAKELEKQLKAWGYETYLVEDFQNVLTQFAQVSPHLVLLDIGLPIYNGYHWCSEIRKVSRVPVIFLSSMTDNMNIIMAMNMGGDDFIEKPFELNVLVAKIQALLRRTYDFGVEYHLIEHRGVVLDTSNNTLLYEGQELPFSKNEYKIMQILLEHHGSIVSREDIMTYLWESDSYIDDNTLTVNITRLRRKLEQIGLKNFIETKKGIGYMIA